MLFTLLTLAASGAATPCSLQGWSIDADPAGLRVHAEPSLASPEIGRLPPAVDGDDRYVPNVDIIDARNGWVRIAHPDDSDNPGRRRPVFGGTGWVHGSRVAFTVQSGTGRARPDVRAPAIVKRATGSETPAATRTRSSRARAGGRGYATGSRPWSR